MVSQLSPAWQRKTACSDHLAKISTRFLSATPGTGQHQDLCRVIPFLLHTPELSWVTHDLCKLLTERGHNSTLCHLEDSDAQANMLADALRKQHSGCEFCLLPITSPTTLLAQHLDHVVLLVPASLDAVLAAYQHIKLLAQEPHTPEIGIVLVGPRDQHAAWRYFRKLAVGTLRYLDIPLLNLGFLPEQVTPQHGPDDHHRSNFLTRISERLLRSEFYSTQQLQQAEQGSA
ncbi:MAG TPA: hypothetical protein ENJ80_06845 [Gammaproteobacteria bacterium]|nr:hypothetical protein [Gammaproteobacteria bacterium]